MNTSVFGHVATRKAALASFIADQVRAALAEPGVVVDAGMVESAITAFERGDGTGLQPCRVAVVLSEEERALGQAVSVRRAVGSEVKVEGAFAVEFEQDPSLAVSLLASENRALKVQSSKNNMIVDMHRELVGMLGEIVPALEQSGAGVTLIASAKSLLLRAKAAQADDGGILANVSPMRLLNAIENVIRSYQDILTRYGPTLDRDSLVRGIRVVSDAMLVLEEIHGADDDPQLEDDEGEGSERPGSR